MQHQQYQQGYGAGPTAQGVNMYPAGYQNQHNPINQPQQMYSSGYGSQPSLPRYASQGSVANGAPQNYQHQHQQQQQQAYGSGYGAPSSPLNPSAHRNSAGGPNTAGSGNGLTPRYSTYGYANGGQGAQGGAHPLSNALYADSTSSPTLAGDVDEKKGLASFPPSSSSSSGDSRSNNSRHNVGGKGAAGGAYKRWSGAHIADSGADQRHVKLERIGWIDGLRFIAACIALNGTFFAATITNQSSYSAIQRSSPLYIFRSFGLAITLFLLILGRALSAPLFDIPAGRASPSDGKFGAAAGPTISFPRLTRAMLTRTFRFILPVLVVTALYWALGATNATKDCNQAGMQQPYWNLISRFSGFMTIVFDSFYAFDYRTDIGKLFAGNLWTNAWFFQSSFAVYIVHMMLGNLSSSRYWIYGILGIFMWCTNNFFCVAMIGLVFSDMAAHGQFARIRKWPLPRILILQILLLGLGFALQFINPVRNNLNSAFSTINVTSHDDLTICDLILAACLFLVFETSAVLQVVFGNIVMRLLGKLAPGIYLLAPAITYTVVPTLGISLRNSGSGGSAVLGVTWVVCFAICVVAAIPFHFLVELPSKLAGEYFADFVEKWGRSKDDIAAPAANGSKVQTKGPQKSAPKKLSGPGAK